MQRQFRLQTRSSCLMKILRNWQLSALRTTALAGPEADRAREALSHYNSAVQQLKSGNWAGFGAELDALRPLLEELSSALRRALTSSAVEMPTAITDRRCLTRRKTRVMTARHCPRTPLSSAVKFAVDLYGAFPVKRLFWVVLTVFCSERERPFFVPSPAIRSPERAEGVKGPKR